MNSTPVLNEWVMDAVENDAVRLDWLVRISLTSLRPWRLRDTVHNAGLATTTAVPEFAVPVKVLPSALMPVITRCSV